MSKVIDSTNLGHLWDLIKQYADGAVAAIASKLVPSGGTTGQVLAKASGTDWDLAWVNQSGGGSSPTMEDTDVDAAVEAAWSRYVIRAQNGNSTNYTIDKTHAVSGETVTVTITSMSGITGVSVSTGLSGGEPIASWNTVGAHTFTMPASDVHVDATIEMGGGGSN